MTIQIQQVVPTITYDQYCTVLTATFTGQEVAFGFPPKLLKFANDAKTFLDGWTSQLKISITDVLKSLLNRDVFNFLSKIGFNLKKVLLAAQKALSIVKQGLVRVFEMVEKEGWLVRLKEGSAKADEFFNRFPLLKKLTGPVIAGLLLYTWLNMSFTGDFEYDMDLTTMFQAFTGTFSLQDLLSTPTGLTQVTLLVTGLLTGGALSFPWLAGSAANLILAIVYTGAKSSKVTPVVNQVRQAIQRKTSLEVSTVSAKSPTRLNK